MSFERLAAAVQDRSPVSGLTHCFYRYPARFSPTFAGAVIEMFSRSGDLVLDPYMGGGTTIVEAFARGRDSVGTDVNSLSAFVARVKTTPLDRRDVVALRAWAEEMVPHISYWDTPADLEQFVCKRRTHNLTLPRARPIKKAIALALRSLGALPRNASKDFARCALLNAGQLFLNGQRRTRSLSEFRYLLRTTVHAI